VRSRFRAVRRRIPRRLYRAKQVEQVPEQVPKRERAHRSRPRATRSRMSPAPDQRRLIELHSIARRLIVRHRTYHQHFRENCDLERSEPIARHRAGATVSRTRAHRTPPYLMHRTAAASKPHGFAKVFLSQILLSSSSLSLPPSLAGCGPTSNEPTCML